MAIGIFSRRMLRIPHLAELLGQPVVAARLGYLPATVSQVAGWGYKPSSQAARRYAERHALPYLTVEDGFLRSLGLGDDPPLSLVCDDLGIYYDATRPSRLEALIVAASEKGSYEHAKTLIAAWRLARVSKYNRLREYEGALPARYVLVVDQTRGDASVSYGMADEMSFQRMLVAALDENPDSMVLLKIHPEVMTGRKCGYFDLAWLASHPRIKVLRENVHPVRLIEHAEAIYTVTSQTGFEGLLWGKPVRTFGMPFYAGWGLTQDELPAPSRRKPVQLEALVHAALIDYPRYLDPETGCCCEVERVVDWMGFQRRMQTRFPPVVYAVGFSIYKRSIVRSFFQGSEVRFLRDPGQVPEEATLAVWGKQSGGDRLKKVVRLEDGFIRSIGLGADLVRPLSWVMDEQGIYYDATRPSSLEVLLQTTAFDDVTLARAKAIRQRLVQEGVTKYNVGTRKWQRPVDAKRVILVPGQVESDASITWGTQGIRHNIDLLRKVRVAVPNAYVVYKPHPDVVAGLRRRGSGESEVACWCDEVVTDVNMGELLLMVDEVHTLTSLAGFEALLRGKRVVCYGHPFYAGWGLTEDVIPIGRRQRRLMLDELVAGVLILYPVYVSRETGRFTTPEQALNELLEWRSRTSSFIPWWAWLNRFITRWVLRRV